MARRIQVLLAAALMMTSIVAGAQYPDRPLRLVIPFPGGGGPANVAGFDDDARETHRQRRRALRP